MHTACAYTSYMGELQPTAAVGSGTSVPKAPRAAHGPSAAAARIQHSPDTRVSLRKEESTAQYIPPQREAAATFTPHLSVIHSLLEHHNRFFICSQFRLVALSRDHRGLKRPSGPSRRTSITTTTPKAHP